MSLNTVELTSARTNGQHQPFGSPARQVDT
jgi:hypothetical protein